MRKHKTEEFCDGLDREHCGCIEYRAKALDYLTVNRDKLDITKAQAKQILQELYGKHNEAKWETAWLTRITKQKYFALRCINNEQKTRLWALVQRLKASTRLCDIRPGTQHSRLPQLLEELQACTQDSCNSCDLLKHEHNI
jgi:hypothetical protein